MGKTKLFVTVHVRSTVRDYGFGFIFLHWKLTLFHGKNITGPKTGIKCKLPIPFYSTKMADSIVMN